MDASPEFQNVVALEAKLRAVTPALDLDQFRLWHVESLLNQSADLLDRIVRDRNEYFDLKARWDQLTIQEHEDQIAVAALEKQLAVGMWDTDLAKATEDARVREVMKPKFEDTWTKMKQYAKAIEDAPGDTPITHIQALGVAVQAEIAYQFNILDATIKALQKGWEQSQKNARLQGLTNLKAINAEKAALLKSGGSLYYPYRFVGLEKRIARDYIHAFERLLVADKGLEVIYNYFDTAGAPRLPLKDPGDGSSLLDSLVIWVRSAIRWLSAFGQLDQAWTMSVSVRQLMGDDTFKTALKTDGPAILNFVLPTERLTQHAFVRLRGMALFVVGDELSGPLRATLDVPRRAIINYLVGEKGLNPSPIDQTTLPVCHFGRIESRRSPRAPEVAGMVTLMNASPISDENYKNERWWRLAVDPFRKKDLEHCEDVHLELNLLGRPIRVRQ